MWLKLRNGEKVAGKQQSNDLASSSASTFLPSNSQSCPVDVGTDSFGSSDFRKLFFRSTDLSEARLELLEDELGLWTTSRARGLLCPPVPCVSLLIFRGTLKFASRSRSNVGRQLQSLLRWVTLLALSGYHKWRWCCVRSLVGRYQASYRTLNTSQSSNLDPNSCCWWPLRMGEIETSFAAEVRPEKWRKNAKVKAFWKQVRCLVSETARLHNELFIWEGTLQKEYIDSSLPNVSVLNPGLLWRIVFGWYLPVFQACCRAGQVQCSAGLGTFRRLSQVGAGWYTWVHDSSVYLWWTRIKYFERILRSSLFSGSHEETRALTDAVKADRKIKGPDEPQPQSPPAYSRMPISPHRYQSLWVDGLDSIVQCCEPSARQLRRSTELSSRRSYIPAPSPCHRLAAGWSQHSQMPGRPACLSGVICSRFCGPIRLFTWSVSLFVQKYSSLWVELGFTYLGRRFRSCLQYGQLDCSRLNGCRHILGNCCTLNETWWWRMGKLFGRFIS